MKLRSEHALAPIVFAAWLLPRIFPLAAYPGLYSYDAWTHLGYSLALLQNGHIPLVNYANYSYYVHPAMHVLALMLYYYLGLPVGICLQVLTILLPFLLFLTFYVFLRAILKTEWQVQTGMLILALSPDVLAASNAALPEALALSFMALGFALIVKMIRQQQSIIQNSVLLAIATICLYLSHHLATLMFCLGCIGFCICLLVLRRRRLWSIGLPVTVVPAATGLILLLTFDPFTQGFLTYLLPRYALLLVLLIFVTVLLIMLGPRILGWIERIRARTPSWLPATSGIIFALVLLVLLISFYPTERPLDWVVYKFTPLTILVTLAGVVASRVASRKNPEAFELAFPLFWLGILGVTFIISTLLAFARPASWQLLTIEASLAHRHFTYITIATIPLACTFLAIFVQPYIHRKNERVRLWRRTFAVGLVALLGCTLVVASCNVYAPAGGWYPTWFSESEIDAAFWLAQTRGAASTTVTDQRLVALFRGVSPYLPSNNSVKPFILSYLTNPIQASGKGNTYYFVTNVMEAQFMADFSTPPSSIAIRAHFDPNERLARIYASAAATIYLVNT
jgi:hypothetical protein